MSMNRMLAIENVMSSIHSSKLIAGLLRLAVALVLAVPLASAAADQTTFPTPEAAVDALLAALKANDDAALVAMVGEKHKALVVTSDKADDAARHARAAAYLQTFRSLEERGNDRRVLLVGAQAWPYPIPLVRQGGGWRFAAEEGVEELLNRRIGGNERNAIRVLNAYLAAQRDYASVDRNGDGVREYARKLGSAPGKKDGLYWPADEAKGEEMSPFGPLIAETVAYAPGRKAGDPYRGYRFRILTRQGNSAAGGAYSYLINGRMIAGFAMVAYPAEYGQSGVMTFIVNHNGKIYEKDLGPGSAGVAAKMTSFNPGPGWKEVAP
jgi:hypothetical protein